jgi:transposase
VFAFDRRREFLHGGYVQADETSVNFLDPELKMGKALQGYLWVIGKPGGNVVFDWRLSRRHVEASTFLEGFEGVLQSDGYGAFESFVENHPNVIRVACLAHIRRKFTEAINEDPVAVNFVLRLIGKLYHWESQWNEKQFKGAEQRTALRLSHLGLSLSLLRRVVPKPLPSDSDPHPIWSRPAIHDRTVEGASEPLSPGHDAYRQQP